jgi:hypothetical protein
VRRGSRGKFPIRCGDSSLLKMLLYAYEWNISGERAERRTEGGQTGILADVLQEESLGR